MSFVWNSYYLHNLKILPFHGFWKISYVHFMGLKVWFFFWSSPFILSWNANILSSWFILLVRLSTEFFSFDLMSLDIVSFQFGFSSLFSLYWTLFSCLEWSFLFPPSVYVLLEFIEEFVPVLFTFIQSFICISLKSLNTFMMVHLNSLFGGSPKFPCEGQLLWYWWFGEDKWFSFSCCLYFVDTCTLGASALFMDFGVSL